MAESKLKVANLALNKVGARFISSFNEDSTEAKTINEVYIDILDEVLSEHMWTFAQKRAILSVVTGDPIWTEDGVSVIYSLPSDFIKINFQSDPNALVKIEGNRLLSDVEGLKILYTYRNDDPTKYFAKFTQALAQRLAAEVAFPLAQSVKKARDLLDIYTNISLPTAISADSQQGTPTEPKQDEWLIARLVGSGGFRTTGETWHPF